MELEIIGNPGTNNRFDETHIKRVGNYCPNATHTVQNILISGEAATGVITSLLNHDGKNGDDTQLCDMYFCSTTHPSPISNEIIRTQELRMCEERLTTDNILFLTGEENIGLTTLLAQFAKTHGNNCVSYFNNGLDRNLLDPEYIEKDIATQLNWFANIGKGKEFDLIECDNISTVTHKVMRKMNVEKSPLYLVFDGFDKIPSERVDSIRRIFEKFVWSKYRFIFSGDKDKIKRLLPELQHIPTSTQQILPFSDGDVNQYFRNIDPNLTEEDLNSLRKISRCQAGRMSIIYHNYMAKGRLRKLLDSDIGSYDDLYEDDFRHMFTADDGDLPYCFLTLLAYAEFPITTPLACEILNEESAVIAKLMERYKDYLAIGGDQRVTISTEGFHKYLRSKLSRYKRNVELDIIRVFEDPSHKLSYSSYIPALYKDLNLNEKLIEYLSKENIHRIFVNRHTQAALNEQCEYGYEACSTNMDKYASGIIRFALNKSTSREIEENRLLDHEIEALLAVGRYEQAIALAQSVYLSEERLKSFVLIARKKKELPPSDYEVIKENIDMLLSVIEFERIPKKAIELAKLLLPVDYQAAIGIVDRVANSNKDSINTDRVYTLMSLVSTPLDADTQDVNNRDVLDVRIKDSDLRSFAHAAKSLFAEESIDVFLESLSSLPSNSHKLHLLQMWLPEHEDKENIGKVVLEGIKLIMAESDTSMPRASMLNTFCRSMSKMTREEMERALTIIDSLSETIKYPTLDYIDAELTLIESMRQLMPDQAISRLENLYLYICELKDESIRMSCLSKLLGRYAHLGDKRRIEREIVSTVDLRNEISIGIKRLLHTTACHIKIVEEPIKALVCEYPTLIDEFIREVNTSERRSRAYSLAACYYVLQAEPSKFNVSYFFSLVSRATYRNNDSVEPLTIFTDRVLYDDKLDADAVFPPVKSNIVLFQDVERVTDRCRLYLRLYRWANKKLPDDTFVDHLKHEIIHSWRTMDHPTFKIQFGYFISKELARVSVPSALELLSECDSLKKDAILTSSSGLSACNEAIELYTQSLCYLIRFGMCDESHVNQFKDEVDALLSEEEKLITWGTIALEYYLANDHRQFIAICNRYLPNDYSHLPLFSQKCVIYNNSAVLFTYSHDAFFSLLTHYDETFRNDCIEKATRFVIAKHAAFADVSIERKSFDIAYDDYLNILALMAKSTSDEYLYKACETLYQSFRNGHPKHPLSTDQKRYIVAEAKRIVNEILPVSSGIRHNGYKIVCLATLDYALTEFSTKDKKEWQALISTVDNTADQAFLNFSIGPFFQRRNDKQEFFDQGLALTDSIPSYYDRVNRLDMSINVCRENSMADMIKEIATRAMTSLSKNGSLEDHLHIVDAVYQSNPSLAEQMLDNIDKDPARTHYKRKLLEHISSKKRLEQAHKDQVSVEKLSKEEQLEFFAQQMADLVCGKAQLLDLSRLLRLTIRHIYDNNLSQSKNAIYYLVESLYRKQGKNKEHKELLYGIHSTIRYNLKLVLSLAAKTKESLQRIDETICRSTSDADGYVGSGECRKGEGFILQWVESNISDALVIIDPYFAPDDLQLIKRICDINNDATIDILCHKRKVTADDFSSKWRDLSNGVTNSVNIHFVYYEGKPDDGPLLDRYWICSNNENDEHLAIKPPSVNSLGSKESSICQIDRETTWAALNSFNMYAFRHPKRKGEKLLVYDHVELA